LEILNRSENFGDIAYSIILSRSLLERNEKERWTEFSNIHVGIFKRKDVRKPAGKSQLGEQSIDGCRPTMFKNRPRRGYAGVDWTRVVHN
jgi:hypothetical protein